MQTRTQHLKQEERRKNPSTGSRDYWLKRGIKPLVARALSRAGIRSMKQLSSVTREEFLSHRGLALRAIAQCEELLGRPLPSAREHWLALDLKPWIAWKLSCSRILTLDDLGRLTAEQLLHLGITPDETSHLIRLAERSKRREGGALHEAPHRRGSS